MENLKIMSESKIQQLCYIWYQNNYCLPKHEPRCLILHIPNQNQHHLVSIGVYPGAADLMVYHFGKLYFIEMKDAKGKQSENQVNFEKHSIQSGIHYCICRSLDEFKEIFDNFESFL